MSLTGSPKTDEEDEDLASAGHSVLRRSWLRRTVDSAAGVVALVTLDEAVGEAFAGRVGPLILATDSLLPGSGAANGATLAEILAII